MDLFILAVYEFRLEKNREYLAKTLTWADDLIFHKKGEDYFSKSLAIFTRRYSLDNDLNQGFTPAKFDDYLYCLAKEVWSHALHLSDGEFKKPDYHVDDHNYWYD